MAAKAFKAKVDFHFDKHYSVGAAYSGPDAKMLFDKGLIEEGEGHNKPDEFEQKFGSMRVQLKKKHEKALQAKGE